MIYNVPILQLVFYIEYWWLKKANQVFADSKIFIPKTMFILSQVGLFFSAISNLHVYSAYN